MFFKLITLVHLCTAFQLKCPEPAQWRLRANGHCADPSKYFCLRNDLINGYSENCTKFDFQQAGRKSVLRGGIDAEVCSKERYQPSGYIFYTNASTNCMFFKSFCNEVGQVAYDHGNRTNDATCRCDYRKGYDFIIKPNNPCFCKPSQEDCSCYVKICSNSSHILSPDYSCIFENGFTPVAQCPAIKYEIDTNGRRVNVTETVLAQDSNLYQALAYGTHDWLEIFLNREISKLECTIYGLFIMEFQLSQVILNATTAICAFNLVMRSRNMPLGKWDAYLLCPAFGIPLVLLTIAAVFNQFERNPISCLLKEERGFLTSHFLQIGLLFLVSLVLITALYIIMWIYIRRQTTAMNASFGQQSAVNARRLALKLSLYVLIHVIQFGAGVVEAVWVAIEEPPIGIRYATVFIGATGGMMNGAVYLTVYKN